jgi:hypothetical protein
MTSACGLTGSGMHRRKPEPDRHPVKTIYLPPQLPRSCAIALISSNAHESPRFGTEGSEVRILSPRPNSLRKSLGKEALVTGLCYVRANRVRTWLDVLAGAGRLRAICRSIYQSVTEKLPSCREVVTRATSCERALVSPGYLSAILLGGLLLNLLWGLCWADPVAALVTVPIIAKEGIESAAARTLRGSSRSGR